MATRQHSIPDNHTLHVRAAWIGFAYVVTLGLANLWLSILVYGS